MGVRWPMLALVGVGTAKPRPGERFGTVVDVFFFTFSFFLKNAFKKHTHFWEITAVENMISYLNLYEMTPSSKNCEAFSFHVSK